MNNFYQGNITCKICGNKNNNRSYLIKEKLFGTNEFFDYLECNECGCLQLINPPKDMGKYYPAEYYSFDDNFSIFDSKIKSLIKYHRLKFYILGKFDPIGLFAVLFFNNKYLKKIKPCNVNIDSKILDVGCGSGRLLVNIRKDGFKYLTGADPFIAHDIFYENGVRIYKKNLSELNGKYDLIMLNHSFEHMDQPLEILKNLKKLINPNGTVLIRIPIADSWAWKHYRENWHGLDAPRHYYLHTRKSMEILINKAGFVLDRINYHSSEDQFMGSEQNKRDIPWMSVNSCHENLKKSIFKPRDVRKYKKMARKLNRKKIGDEAGFYLKLRVTKP